MQLWIFKDKTTAVGIQRSRSRRDLLRATRDLQRSTLDLQGLWKKNQLRLGIQRTRFGVELGSSEKTQIQRKKMVFDVRD